MWTYDDVVIRDANGIISKVIRRFTLLDWCTAETLEKLQILRFQDPIIVQTPESVGSCSGESVSFDSFSVSTNDPAVTIDDSNCDTDAGILDYLNCVAENNEIADGSSFELHISKGGDDVNGVSTLNMVLTQRHILGILPLTSFCNIVAADVNNDGKVTGIDLVQTRTVILGINSNYPNSPSWRFYNKAVLDNNGVNIDSDLKFEKSEFPLSGLEIIGIKVGDVNDTAVKN